MNEGEMLANVPDGLPRSADLEGFLQRYFEPIFGDWLYVDSHVWTLVGFLGAGIFGSRFFLQWLQSEKEGRLVVPWYFWHLSFWGSTLNLIYFVHLDKAPLILGNCFLPLLYARNLVLLHRGKHTTLRTEVPDEETGDGGGKGSGE